MPTESVIPPPTPPSQSPDISFSSTDTAVLKCSSCGVSGLSSSSSQAPLHGHEGIVLLNDPLERICGGCVRAQDIRQRMEEAVSEEGDLLALGLGLRGVRVSDGSSGSSPRLSLEEREPVEAAEEEPPKPIAVPTETERIPRRDTTPPPSIAAAQPWRLTSPPVPSTSYTKKEETDDSVPIRLLDICKSRINSKGKGALHPGSIFKGTQTSGRSAYEVEVKIADVNLAESTVSGYLSIQHLTDAHPHLTTFFTGEIIGPEYGFITGSRFGASENDDMRHWGRFEQFRRPATRGDMVRPELFFRDPQPDRSRGETRAKDRDFMFLRIKERFLVPDHRVRDISGASFAGFYYAMIDFSPGLRQEQQPETPLRSPTSPPPRGTPLMPTPGITPTMTSESGMPSLPTEFPLSTMPIVAPPLGRRRVSSSGGGYQAPSYRRSSGDPRSGQARHAKSPGARDTTPSTGEATIRGYYFHSLNQEPFQELFLSHVPTRSVSTFEMR